MIRFQQQPMADRVMAKILVASRYIADREVPKDGAGPDIPVQEPPKKELPPVTPVPEPPPQEPPAQPPLLPPASASGLDIPAMIQGDTALQGLIEPKVTTP